VIFGGVSHRPQIEMLSRGLDVLVATPGRLLDHIASGRFKPATTEFLVLDEADHMLDLGFIVPIRHIVSKLSKNRQTLLFSATMPKEIASLAHDLLKDPAHVAVTPVATTAERVAQHVYLVDGGAKRELLVELMGNPDLSRAIVFTRTKRGADKVAQHLEGAGHLVGAQIAGLLHLRFKQADLCLVDEQAQFARLAKVSLRGKERHGRQPCIAIACHGSRSDGQ
jgi:ATP-dependent RNA helicase RhlE